MTALEIADWIENGAPFGKYETAKQAVVMLRQQQAEIEELRSLSLRRENLGYFYDLHARQQAEIEALKKEKGHIRACPNSDGANSFARVSQSIIANTEDEPNWKEMYWEMHELNHKHWSELKAHPADLTDEEILELTKDSTIFEYREFDDDMVRFARAILRKAQEKC